MKRDQFLAINKEIERVISVRVRDVDEINRVLVESELDRAREKTREGAQFELNRDTEYLELATQRKSELHIKFALDGIETRLLKGETASTHAIQRLSDLLDILPERFAAQASRLREKLNTLKPSDVKLNEDIDKLLKRKK